jgi:hypothetical protein
MMRWAKRFAMIVTTNIFGQQAFVAGFFDAGNPVICKAFVKAQFHKIHESEGKEQDADAPISFRREGHVGRHIKRQAKHAVSDHDRDAVKEDDEAIIKFVECVTHGIIPFNFLRLSRFLFLQAAKNVVGRCAVGCAEPLVRHAVGQGFMAKITINFAQDFGLLERIVAAHYTANQFFGLLYVGRPPDGRIQLGLDRLFAAHGTGLNGTLFEVDDATVAGLD